MNKPTIQPSSPNSIYSQSTPIWPPPMTPQSPCRSTNRRLNITCCPTTKTRRLRYYTSNTTHTARMQLSTLPFPHPSPMRGPNDQLHLLTPNRLKISHCLLIRKPHRTRNRRKHDPNSMIISGAIILIISHGLTSSLLFCLANTNYERTHSRILILTRGLQPLLPLIAT